MVDWSALGALHRRLSLRRRVTWIKFLFRWTPMNVRQHLIGQSGTKKFLLCKNEDETMAHLFCCKNSKAQENIKMVAMTNLEDKLVEAKTHPDLVTLIMLAVDGKMMVLKETPIQNGEDTADLMQQQANIG